MFHLLLTAFWLIEPCARQLLLSAWCVFLAILMVLPSIVFPKPGSWARRACAWQEGRRTFFRVLRFLGSWVAILSLFSCLSPLLQPPPRLFPDFFDDTDYVAISVAPPPPPPAFPNVQPSDDPPEKAEQEEKKGDPVSWLTPVLTRFGFAELKPFQIECLRHVRDRKDVFLIADTGLGKSAVFQGLIDVVEPFGKSITLVVSPLKSLCRDQVTSCGKHPIPILAKHLETIEHLDQRVVAGEYNMLYLAPELLETPEFLAMLETEAYQTRLKTVVIDEVSLLTLCVACVT